MAPRQPIFDAQATHSLQAVTTSQIIARYVWLVRFVDPGSSDDLGLLLLFVLVPVRGRMAIRRAVESRALF